MKIKTIIIFILSFSILAKAQNLVYNGYFEIHSQCPTATSSQGNTQFNYATGWHAASLTPDYYNACSNNTVGVPYNEMGYQQDCCGGGVCWWIYV